MRSHSHLEAKPIRKWVVQQLSGLVLRLSGSPPRTGRGSRKRTSDHPDRVGRSSEEFSPGIETSVLLIALAKQHKRAAKRAVALGKLSRDLLRNGFPEPARRMSRLSIGHWKRSRALAAEIRSHYPPTREKERTRAA